MIVEAPIMMFEYLVFQSTIAGLNVQMLLMLFSIYYTRIFS